MQPVITTTITCVKCGGAVTGGAQDYIVRCPFCGIEYQLSISAVVVEPADVEDKIRILAACATDGNPREKAEACMELAKINGARVVEPVIGALNKLWSDIDCFEANQPAIDALSAIIRDMKDPAAEDILVKALRDENNRTRQLAAYALKNIASQSAAGALIEASVSDDLYVRSAAIEALGKMNDNRVPEILLSALAEKNYMIKISALMALADLRFSGAADSILDIFRDDITSDTDNGIPWMKVRNWAAHALGRIGCIEAVPFLIKALKESDSQLRTAADSALMYIGMSAEDASLKDEISRARGGYTRENN